MIFLYCPQVSNRSLYVAAYLERSLGLQVRAVSPSSLPLSDPCIILNHTGAPLQLKHISIFQSGLLQRSDISTVDIKVKLTGEFPTLFSSECGSYDIHFDLLAAVFYCLSRYEEYLPFIPDDHGRFCSNQSWASEYDLIETPIVEIWMYHLKKVIAKEYPHVQFKKQEFEIRPTVDIDTAWAYSRRSIGANLGRLTKGLLTFDLMRSLTIMKAITKREDPFDTFQLLSELLSETEPVYFWLMNEQLPYDTAYYVDQPYYKRLIQTISSKIDIGLHPSYESYLNKHKVLSEKNKLERISEKSIVRSRQHYLRLSLPVTYQHLIELGFNEDYSMGYSDAIGFRAGTCHPFHFYDLESDESTELIVYPFQVMDVTLRRYLELNIDEARLSIRRIKQIIRRFQGQFCFIWHNSSFAESDGWSGWDKVLTECLQKE